MTLKIIIKKIKKFEENSHNIFLLLSLLQENALEEILRCFFSWVKIETFFVLDALFLSMKMVIYICLKFFNRIICLLFLTLKF